MKNTIIARDFYEVKLFIGLKSGKLKARILDGGKYIFTATVTSFIDYFDECVMHNNECACVQEVFSDKNNIQYIYWRDEENDVDYLTINKKSLIEDLINNYWYDIGRGYKIQKYNDKQALISRQGANSNLFMFIGNQIVFEDTLYCNKTTCRLIRRILRGECSL